MVKPLKSSGIPVNYKLSYLYGIFHYCSSHFSILLNRRISSQGLDVGTTTHGDKRYVYFSRLCQYNMPCIDSTDETYTIIDWYFQWKGRTDFDEVKHDFRISNFIYKSVNISYGNLPYLLIKDYLTYFRLLSWFIKYLVFSLLDLFRGKWWSLLLIFELLLAKSASFCTKNMLAEDYMFHYSGLTYRPLWTYIVEEKGSRVITYFYSSYQLPSDNSSFSSNSELWPASTWNHHLVWDIHQKRYLENNLKNNSKIEVAKSIWFFDIHKSIDVPDRSIAVFPIELQNYYMPTQAMQAYS